MSQDGVVLPAVPSQRPADGIAAGAAARAPGDGRVAMQQVEAVIELLPMAVWIANDGHVCCANSAAARLAGSATRHGVVGRSVRSLLHADAHAELQRQTEAVLAHPGTLVSLHAALLRRDGLPCEVEIALSALPDHGTSTLQMVIHDVTGRQREVQELQRSRQALRRLSANIVEGREAERRRIARELHDELGQGLSALKLDLCAFADDTLPEGQRARVQRMQARLDETMAAVRRIALDLRPQMLDDLGLSAAVEWLVRDFSRRTGLRCTMQLDDIGALGDQAGIALYRMVQEALTNVLRHAHASSVHVELRRDADRVWVSVRDNGVGLGPGLPAHDSQFGLLGMRERADMLGGQLQIESLERGGTCVRMQLPLRAAP